MSELSAEAVRLVVWDLDETFWKGTLSEGGITFCPENRDTVIALAERGIMSTICSKNDFEAVRDVLKTYDVWDYFIFPSVNWEPKGPRLQGLIDSIQLRPQTVMLIDDNPMNRNEAQYFVPGIQVADETVIPHLLSNPLFKGKDDRALTRLQQYKLLEKRKSDEVAAGGSNLEFLRSSRVRIAIEHDIESHVDRVVELVNRTNQLNFTKRRLPEDRDAAEAAIKHLAAAFDVQTGLIRVRDKYGDYGFCGFFAMQTLPGGEKVLLHYCFSCRILNMGVEAFVYQLLNRPGLTVTGEVLSDPAGADPVDWIALTEEQEQDDAPARQSAPVFLRGGCDLAAIDHYARMVSSEVAGEYNLIRNGIHIRRDHSLLTRYAIEGVPEAAAAAFYRLGYAPEDFRSSLFNPARPGRWVLSLLADLWVPLYRHNATGALIPFLGAPGKGLLNLCELSEGERREIGTNPTTLAALETLAREFAYVGRSPEAVFKANLETILRAIPDGSEAFIILHKEFFGQDDRPDTRAKAAIAFNRWMRDVAESFPGATCLSMTDFVENRADIHPDNHFHRLVYYRVFEHINGTAPS
jgi:FkbH-like protein